MIAVIDTNIFMAALISSLPKISNTFLANHIQGCAS